MAITSINTLKQWFQTAMRPTQEQFWAIFDSFRHKSDKVPASDIEGMDDLLLSKADKQAFTVHLSDEAAHATLFGTKVDKVTGKVLTDQNFTVEEKNKLAGIYQWIAANVQGVPNLGALNPSMVPAGTGAAYWFSMVAGAYPNAGGVVVQANNLAVIIRDTLGSFTISQTALSVDLSTYATKTYVEGLVVGLLDDRGSYNASVNTFPTTGGSGTAGAVTKGDLWYVSVAGTLGGKAVKVGSSFRALVDAPAQVAANWALIDTALGFVPESTDNKNSNIAANPTSTTQFPTNKAVVDFVAANAGKIKAWVDGAYTIDSQVNYLGKDWCNTVATVAGEIPGTSSKWVNRLVGMEGGAVALNESKNVSGGKVFDALNGYKIDGITWTDGSRLNTADGLTTVFTTHSVSNFIDVREKGSLEVKGVTEAFRLCLYNESNVFISGSEQSVDSVFNVENASFIRYSSSTAKVSTTKIYLKDVLLSDAKLLKINNSMQKNQSLTEELLVNYIGINKYNKNQITLFSANLYSSNYIRVTESDIVRRSFGGTRYWYTYDANKVLLRSNIVGTDTLVVLAGEVYVRSLFDISHASYPTATITVNDAIPTVYVDYVTLQVPFFSNNKYTYPQLNENRQLKESAIPLLSNEKIPLLTLPTTEGYTNTINLFDKRQAQVYSGNATRRWTNYIKVTAGDIIRRNINAAVWGIYDANKNPINEAVAGSLEYTVPVGTLFVRSVYDFTVEDTFMVTLNKPMPLKYVSFGYENPLLHFLSKDTLALNNASDWKDKTIAFLGDSITTGFIPRNAPEGNYPGVLDSYAKLVCADLGATLLNFGNVGHQLNTQFTTTYLTIPDTVDLVVVMGGTNDIRNGVLLGTMADRTTATWYGGLHVLCQGLVDKYWTNQVAVDGRKKQLFFMTPLKLSTTYGTTYNGSTIQDFGAAMKKVCNYYSIPVFDMESESGINPHLNLTIQGWQDGYNGMYNPYITDGTHPTQAGHRIMANRLKGYLKQLR